MTPCPHCRMVTADELAEVVAAGEGKGSQLRPPARHGHRVHIVRSATSLWLFWAPDRKALVDLFVATKGRSPSRLSCRLANLGDLRRIVEANEEWRRVG